MSDDLAARGKPRGGYKVTCVEGLHAPLVVGGMVMHLFKNSDLEVGMFILIHPPPEIVTGHHISRHFQMIVPRKEDGPDTIWGVVEDIAWCES